MDRKKIINNPAASSDLRFGGVCCSNKVLRSGFNTINNTPRLPRAASSWVLNHSARIKLLGIIMIAATLGISVTACKTTQPSGPQTVITVVGIPEKYNGNVGMMTFNDKYAYAIASVVNSAITLPVLDWEKDMPFSLNGNYEIYFILSQDLTRMSGEEYLYIGVIMSRNIINENVTIQWGEIIQY